MVLALVTNCIGYEKTIGRAWMSVEDPEDHPQFKSKVSPSPFEKEREGRYELSLVDEDLDFEDTTNYNENNKNELTRDCLYDTMIKQIVCVFVHQTSWVEGPGRLTPIH